MTVTINNIWKDIISWDNLCYAWQQARKRKRYKPEVLRFSERWEENLLNLHNHLVWGTWEPGELSSFPVYEPKKRIIEAPVFVDRIIHHAMYAYLEPIFERRFIKDSYACRKGSGTHRAVFRVQEFLRRAKRKWGQVYVLQADIASYFPSIPHARLLRQVCKVVSDIDLIYAWELFLSKLNRKVGMPIGALTSQLGANIHLDVLDHQVKDEMGEPFYIRYMDDWLILAPCKAHLWDRLHTLREFLADELSLALNPKTRIYPAHQGVDFAGYRTWATHILPRKRNVKAARKRLAQLILCYRKGKIKAETLRGSLASFLGYTKHCAANFAVEGILNETGICNLMEYKDGARKILI